MKKLPIGLQTFSHIRNDNYIYVDKTKEAYSLINNYRYVFLSRPRRFGKSLFLDTLKEIFQGNKELFKGLYIYDKYDFEKHPVIKISFNSGDFFTSEGFDETLQFILRNNYENLGLPCDKSLNSTNSFSSLIKEAYKKYKKNAVILIDEYDKPILDNIEKKEERNKRREELKSFYSVIKDNDAYIRFTFLTGVSKFSKVSIFSGLNNIVDVSLNPDYGNICGYTQHNVENDFKELLADADLGELKKWYNGYNFLKDNVYNPFDILLFIRNHFSYKNYWFETGTPSFLIKLIKEQNYYLPDLENLVIGEEILNSFEIDNIRLDVLLYQTGYLTIKEVFKDFDGIKSYKLDIPNREVQLSLYKEILHSLHNDYKNNNRKNIYMALQEGNLVQFKESLISLFASLPYQNYANNNIQIYEGFYASVIYSYLASLGLPLSAEESTNRGRLDLSLQIDNKVYIIEFKMNEGHALKQIKSRRYYEKYLNTGREIYLVGINFDEAEKNISAFEWEKLGV